MIGRYQTLSATEVRIDITCPRAGHVPEEARMKEVVERVAGEKERIGSQEDDYLTEQRRAGKF